MWPALIVVQALGFDRGLRFGDRRELVHVQALVPEPPIERPDEGVFDGLAGADEVEWHPAAIRPVFERPRLKLGAVPRRWSAAGATLHQSGGARQASRRLRLRSIA